jgi:hypothetical protein
VQGMRSSTLRLNLCSDRADDDGGRRNLRNRPSVLRKNGDDGDGLRLPRLDSFHGDAQGDGAVLQSSTARRGVVGRGGAMVVL